MLWDGRKRLWLLSGSSILLALGGRKMSFLVMCESLPLRVLSRPGFSVGPGCKLCSSMQGSSPWQEHRGVESCLELGPALCPALDP